MDLEVIPIRPYESFIEDVKKALTKMEAPRTAPVSGHICWATMGHGTR